MRSYLVKIAKQHDNQTAFKAIQQVQLWTLQMAASRRAAQDLSSHPNTAISFCNEIAIQTNNATLLPLTTTGNIGRAVAILAKPQEKEYEQPLRLWINEFPLPEAPKFWFSKGQFFAPEKNDWLADFREKRFKVLSERLDYAKQQLQNCQNYNDITDYKFLLYSLLQYAKVKNIGDILSIVEQPISAQTCPTCIQSGWNIIQKFNQQFIENVVTGQRKPKSASMPILSLPIRDKDVWLWPSCVRWFSQAQTTLPQ